MLNLNFVFDDALKALRSISCELDILPLPASVYMMQQDVINHYQNAFGRRFKLSLNDSSLQNSSLGTPFQKWSFFANEKFKILTLLIHNLLRYTSRLVHETECRQFEKEMRFDEMKRLSNYYTGPICEIAYHNRYIGFMVLENELFEVSTFQRDNPISQNLGMRQKYGEKANYYIKKKDESGSIHEIPVSMDEYHELSATIKKNHHSIHDRSLLEEISEKAVNEVALLKETNKKFELEVNQFYKSQPVIKPFENLNESWWML
jgi:hypothetical protein